MDRENRWPTVEVERSLIVSLSLSLLLYLDPTDPVENGTWPYNMNRYLYPFAEVLVSYVLYAKCVVL